jgi:hypothetical protein
MDYSCYLSTFDNPFDPYEDFLSWFMFDIEKGYDCCGYLARIVELSDEMTQKEIDEELEKAIDEILKYDFMGIFIKVRKESTPRTDASDIVEVNE